MQVKALFWTREDENYVWASTPFGDYTIKKFKTFEDYEEENGVAYIWFAYFNGSPVASETLFTDVEEAKNICRVHFETSLYSCFAL